MAKVILICGRICSGKSTYAQQLRLQRKAALLSIDEIMLALFGQHLGEKHDEIAQKTEKYLLDKSVELIGSGIDVILDWGFWEKKKRDFIKTFYKTENIECEFHYIDISDEEWNARIAQRNRAVLEDETKAYFVDDNLAAKFRMRFEAPEQDEIDVWIKQ